jgi:hypothetical protein
LISRSAASRAARSISFWMAAPRSLRRATAYLILSGVLTKVESRTGAVSNTRRKWRRTRARARRSSMTARRSGSRRTRSRGSGCEIQPWIPMKPVSQPSVEIGRHVHARRALGMGEKLISPMHSGQAAIFKLALTTIGKGSSLKMARPFHGILAFMPIYGRLPRKAIFWCRRRGMHESIRPVAGLLASLVLMRIRCFSPHKIIGLEGLGINQA